MTTEFKAGKLVCLHKGYVGNAQNLIELPVCFWADKDYEHFLGTKTEYYLVPTDSPFLILKIEEGYARQGKVVTVLCGEKTIKVDTRHLEIFTEASNV